jgi:hypothetical protein
LAVDSASLLLLKSFCGACLGDCDRPAAWPRVRTATDDRTKHAASIDNGGPHAVRRKQPAVTLSDNGGKLFLNFLDEIRVNAAASLVVGENRRRKPKRCNKQLRSNK